MSAQKIVLDDGTISDIRNNLQVDGKEIDKVRMNKLLNLRKKISYDKVAVAQLYVMCYDILTENYPLMKLDKKESKIKKMLDTDCIKKIRLLIYDYHDGNAIGDYYQALKIKEEVENYYDEMKNFIGVFFRIFEEE